MTPSYLEMKRHTAAIVEREKEPEPVLSAYFNGEEWPDYLRPLSHVEDLVVEGGEDTGKTDTKKSKVSSK